MNICRRYSIEVPYSSGSDEYPQHIVANIETYLPDILSYLKLWVDIDQTVQFDLCLHGLHRHSILTFRINISRIHTICIAPDKAIFSTEKY